MSCSSYASFFIFEKFVFFYFCLCLHSHSNGTVSLPFVFGLKLKLRIGTDHMIRWSFITTATIEFSIAIQKTYKRNKTTSSYEASKHLLQYLNKLHTYEKKKEEEGELIVDKYHHLKGIECWIWSQTQHPNMQVELK